MPVKRPIFRYCVLAFLFAITVAYEVPYLHDVLRDQAQGRHVPFFSIEAATDRVDIVTRDAAQAGIHKGDEVLSIDGQPYKGLNDWAHPFADTGIGGSITFVLRSSDPSNPGEHVVVLPVTSTDVNLGKVAGELALYFLLPALCVLLGFWVALQRPRSDGLVITRADVDLPAHIRKLQSRSVASRMARGRGHLPRDARIDAATHDVFVYVN